MHLDFGAPPAPSTAAASPSARSQAEEDCGQTVAPAVEIDDLALRAANGVTLNAAIVGSGPRGVILLHQTDDGLCGWLTYAGYLATQGFHIGLFDFRCTFNSSCVDGDNAYNVTADVSAMAAELRKRRVLRRARPNVVAYVELPSGAGHGWETVADPDNPDQRSSFSDRLIDFITDNR
jgi:hypothetical protein